MLLTPLSARSYTILGESCVNTDPAVYASELHSIPAILVTESDDTGSFGLMCEGLGLQFGPPVGAGPSVGCCDGDDDVGDGVTDVVDLFG